MQGRGRGKLTEQEKSYLKSHITLAKTNTRGLSTQLGISFSTLYRLLRNERGGYYSLSCIRDFINKNKYS